MLTFYYVLWTSYHIFLLLFWVILSSPPKAWDWQTFSSWLTQYELHQDNFLENFFQLKRDVLFLWWCTRSFSVFFSILKFLSGFRKWWCWVSWCVSFRFTWRKGTVCIWGLNLLFRSVSFWGWAFTYRRETCIFLAN